MPGCQGVQDAEQVGDGAPAQGQDGGESKEDEAAMDRPRERRLERIEDGANRLGKSLVNPFESSPCDSGFARLLSSHGTESLAELLLRQSRAGPIGYSRHGSLRVCDAGP